jgi:tRNA A37 threonylcarbamoyladenosine modification protein TsaB
LATVKLWRIARDVEVSGVSTLAAIAHASGIAGEVVALLPAGRGEVFAQRFATEQGSFEAIDAAAHLSPGALLVKVWQS